MLVLDELGNANTSKKVKNMCKLQPVKRRLLIEQYLNASCKTPTATKAL